MRRATVPVLVCLALLGPIPGCSVRKLAVNGMADALAGSGDVYASDDDPELVRDATPFALKTIEGLLAEVPRHRVLLLEACKGFAQYAYAFVETDAMLIEFDDYRRSRELRERALRLYLRAKGYGLRLLELDHPGIGERLRVDPEAAVADASVREVAALFWTGAAWGGAVSAGRDRPAIVADLPAVQALMRRVLELDESFDGGAVEEMMIVLEGLPEVMGGSPERARMHFERAVELSGGRSASPYVTLAQSVSIGEQDRQEFRSLLDRALRVDPDAEPSLRLVNLIVQKRARYLLEHTDDLFLGAALEIDKGEE